MATVCLATRLNNVFFNYQFSPNTGLGILFITFLVYLGNTAFIINNTAQGWQAFVMTVHSLINVFKHQTCLWFKLTMLIQGMVINLHLPSCLRDLKNTVDRSSVMSLPSSTMQQVSSLIYLRSKLFFLLYQVLTACYSDVSLCLSHWSLPFFTP